MKRVFIFEGPDGVGKSTLALALAKHIGAVYIHHGSYPQATENDLIDIYSILMIPAVSGIVDVVMDRSWLSEKPYGLAFRGGADRIGIRGEALEAFIERKAQLLVIRCDADFDTIKENWQRRKGNEYLENTSQLFKVWSWYRNEFMTTLPTITVWPFVSERNALIERILGNG